ncbi:MAG: sulfide-dependent adenosine diphosphate thiazole synthase [bacterium]|nr:sulfide-dependent adenosine diphosphate thiazole synthase [bacterium]
MKFSKVSEAEITGAMAQDFYSWFSQHLKNDVIVIGGGPSGLVAAHDLAKAGKKVLLIESNNYLGGGFWTGGYLMNTLTFRSPGEQLLKEFGIPCREASKGLFIGSAPQICAKLIAATADSGARILNLTRFDDVLYKDKKVKGVVINWTPVAYMPRAISCLDPVTVEAKVVIDATGHDACVCKSLAKRGLLQIADFGPMDVESSEEQVVEKSGEIFPGLIICGMSVSTAYGVPRMGPTFSAMLYSGRKAAEVALKKLGK